MVYVVQRPPAGINLNPAARYGELVEVLPAGDITMSPAPTMFRLRRKLKDFGDGDYLLLIGDPVAIGMAMHVAVQTNNGRAKVLRWMRDVKDYAVVTVEDRPNVAD